MAFEKVHSRSRQVWASLHTIPEWKLGDKVVCKSAWQAAHGVSENKYKVIYSWVLRGYSATEHEAHLDAAPLRQILDRVGEASGRIATERRQWCADWWSGLLLLMDWMPNEQRIVIKGPGYDFLHKEVYGPVAKAMGMHLSYKMFMVCIVGCCEQCVYLSMCVICSCVYCRVL